MIDTFSRKYLLAPDSPVSLSWIAVIIDLEHSALIEPMEFSIPSTALAMFFAREEDLKMY